MNEEHQKIYVAVARIEQKQDDLKEIVLRYAEENNKRLASHGQRLNKVETRQSWLLGVGAAVSAVAMSLWNYLSR